MTALNLIQTALLLGLYVVLAGGYGVSYAVARLRDGGNFPRMPCMIFALHGLTAIAIVGWTPLQAGWKGLIIASSAAFLVIPPVTWRFLQHTHETEVPE